MQIKFGFGALYIGRPTGIASPSVRDVAVMLCLGRRGDVPFGEPVWRRIYRAAWNWLPDRIYRDLTAVEPRLAPALIATRRMSAAISGTDFSYSPPVEGAIDSSRWTGRDKAFVGFGAWRREAMVLRSTWRSKMYVYLTGQKERQNPKHILRVTPGALVPASSVPSDWKNDDGTLKNFEIEFMHGRASVAENVGELLIKKGLAQRTNLVRRTGSTLGALASAIAGR